MILKRIIYLIYYLRVLDWDIFNKYIQFVKEQKKVNSLSICVDIIISIYLYNIGIMDYFIFKFFEKKHSERSKWVGTGYKYEYDLYMNPKKVRDILQDKIKFNESYAPFIIHSTCTINDLMQINARFNKVFNNQSGKIVVKDALGQCGWDVEVLNTSGFTPESLLKYMQNKKFNLIEEFIVQHPQLAKLSSSGLNTIRMITQLNENGDVDLLGARLRISVNNHVDNLASGNIAAPIDLLTGKVCGPAVYSDITKDPVTHHPVTGIEITGFQIPLWDKIMEIVKKAALFRPENKSIGWDVALTEIGPEFIEANHNWCKILWQLPVNQGLKHVLEKYHTPH